MRVHEVTEQNGGDWLSARRLLIVRADNIGDVVMTGPALRAIRERLPSVSLTLLASPAGAEAAALLPWLDDVLRWRVLWQDLGRLAFDPARERLLFDTLRRGRFDGAIILTSFSQTPHPAAFAACMAGIPLRAGCSRERGTLLTHAVPHGDDAQHQAERNLALVEALGFPARDRALELRVPDGARDGALRLLRQCGLEPGESWALYNPWASAAARTYPPLRGAEAMRRIAADTGFRVVVTAHERDRERAAEVAARIGPAAIDVAGRTSVCELAGLVEGAALVVTGNTSVLHLADAFRTPSVLTFSGTDLWSQWASRAAPHRMLRRPTSCSPCYTFTCPLQFECMDVAPREVADAALELLSTLAPSVPEGDAAASERGAVGMTADAGARVFREAKRCSTT